MSTLLLPGTAASLFFSHRSLRIPPPSSQPRRRQLHLHCSVSSGQHLRIAFASGGSGGHVFPAIAIADEFRASDPQTRILFIGSERGIETRLVPPSGYDFRTVPSTPLARPILSTANLLLPFRLIASVIASWRLLKEFRPDVVVGTGGYVSVPVCLAAAVMRVDVVIQEQNCSPGIANRLIGRFAKNIFLGFEECVGGFGKKKERRVVSGNPIRANLRRFVSKAVARSHFFPRARSKGEGSGEPQVVLVLGGSSGANALNVAVLNAYSAMLARRKNWCIIWQTGEDGFTEMESLVKNHPRVVLTPFLHAMDLAYAAADVVVCRAGAMTCTEILTTGKPSILVPSPCVAEDHQTNNAYNMVEIACSKVIMEDELDPGTLENAICEVLGDEKMMAKMSERALSNSRPDASSKIVQRILSFIKPHASKDPSPF